jgi:prolyl oligopeptidase
MPQSNIPYLLPLPPATPKSEHIDDYHGTQVPDPYRWLEDTNDPDVQAWSKTHNQRTRTFLDQLPTLEKIKTRLIELWNFPKYENIHKAGRNYFITKNDGLQNQAVLYMQDRLDAEPALLLNPNDLSDDGTVAIFQQSYSKDGSLLGYSLSSSGSDWQEIHIMNTETGKKFGEVLQWCKFAGIAWKSDNSGFYYNHFPKPADVWEDDSDLICQVCWHTLGTPQSADVIAYQETNNSQRRFFPYMTEDGLYLCLYVRRISDQHNGFYVRPINSKGNFIKLIKDDEATFDFAGNLGSIFYFLTNLEAPNGRVIAIDFNNPARENWKEIISEETDAIATVNLCNSHLIVVKNHHAHNLIGIYNLHGQHLRDVPLPTMGTVSLLEGSQADSEIFFSFESFLYPRTILRYDFESNELSPIGETSLDFDTAAYITQQVFYDSKDGTRVPMFLTHKKGLEKDGKTPTILYGYGGFRISQTPFFNVWNLVWLEMGGIFALANLRGGTEYGEAWHQAGMLENKQNVFDDFIAAAEWLIAQDFTRTEKLAIEGRSNGGTLTSACFVQRPDLFAAVLCWVPVTDMLRFHKFTVGRYWTSEFGNAEENPEHFYFLYAYSPLHNIRNGVQYPPIIVTTGDTDDRVVPAHSKKFIAELLEKTTGDGPHLLRIDLKAGHKLGKPTYKLIEEHADVLAFAVYTLGMESSKNPI